MIIVSGYYGFANLGDEAILAALCQDLEALGFSRQNILVLSQNPAGTEALHGVRALKRYNLVGIWRALSSARCFISGGGSLLQDVTSRRSIPYYLGLVELALLKKVPVIMYGQGIGPVRTVCFRHWVGRVYRRSGAYSIRDGESAKFLQGLGVLAAKGRLAADPVFQKDLQVQKGAGAPKILFNLRPYRGWSEQQDLWVGLVGAWQLRGFEVEFIPLGPGDKRLGTDLRAQLPRLKVHPIISLADVEKTFAGACLCVSMRLHGIILAALHDVLPLGINYDPKVSTISAQLQVPCWELEDLPSLAAGVEKVLSKHGDYRSAYHASLAELKERALLNRAALAEVLIRE